MGSIFSCRCPSLLAVDVTPVSDLDNQHNQLPVKDLVDDSVVSLTDTVPLKTRELLTSTWTRVVSKGGDALQYRCYLLAWQSLEIPGDRFLEPDLKGCH